MIARRQVFPVLFSLVAAPAVLTVKRPLILLGQSHSPLEPRNEASPPTGYGGFNLGSTIKVIGVGGAGLNVVEHMFASELAGIEYIYADSDPQAQSHSTEHRTVQLGALDLGAERTTELGREAKLAETHDIRAAIRGAHMLFIAAGMGGDTGTVAAPLIARIAKEMGILTVGIATMPFALEGSSRMGKAGVGLAELEANVDSLIVVRNEKLLEALGDEANQDAVFAHANDVLKNVVSGIVEIINVPGMVAVDFEDVRVTLSEPGGRVMVGTAVATGPGRARIAAERALASPLLEGCDLSGAVGVVVVVSGAKCLLRFSDASLAMHTIRPNVSADSHFIYGTFYDDSLGEQIRVTVIAKSVQSGA